MAAAKLGGVQLLSRCMTRQEKILRTLVAPSAASRFRAMAQRQRSYPRAVHSPGKPPTQPVTRSYVNACGSPCNRERYAYAPHVTASIQKIRPGMARQPISRKRCASCSVRGSCFLNTWRKQSNCRTRHRFGVFTQPQDVVAAPDQSLSSLRRAIVHLPALCLWHRRCADR